MPQIDFLNYPFASQLFWLFLSFGILYFSLSRIFVPKITKVKIDRNDLAKNALEEALKLQKEAEAAKSDSENSSNDAQIKAMEFYKKSEAKIAEMKSAALSEINEYHDNLEKTFTLESEKQINSTKPIIKTSALEIAKFILENNFAVKVKDNELTKYGSN